MATRAPLLTYLAGILHPLAVLCAVPETDTTDGYGYALDSTLARMGVNPTPGGDGDLPDALWPAARAIVRYYGLQALQPKAAEYDQQHPPAPHPTPTQVTGAYHPQLFPRIVTMLTEAAAEALALGYPIGIGAQPGFTLGEIYLDFRNPRPPVFIRGRRMSLRGWG